MGTGDRLNAGDTLVLQLSGLPARSTAARYGVLASALVILVIGIGMGFTSNRSIGVGRHQAHRQTRSPDE